MAVDQKAAIIAGLAAGAAYVATMEADNRLNDVNLDDLQLLGRPLAPDARAARWVGVPIHAFNSVALALVYARVAHDRWPGPRWLRGALFATVENTVLYPLTAFEQRHPGIRLGEIDRYFSLRAYVLSTPRHLAYGAVLGAVYEALRKR
jgi:hypothetical protein